MWNDVKSVLNSTRSQFPSQILIAGKLLSKPIEMATAMNKLFLDKIQLLKMETGNGERPSEELKKYLLNKTLPPDGFKLKEISEEETLKLIKTLKGKKSCGLDWICGYGLKLIAEDLLPEFTRIINISIKSGQYFSKWKNTKVLRGYKNKGTRWEAKYYRPISNLSEISKLVEKAIYEQVKGGSKKNNHFKTHLF